MTDSEIIAKKLNLNHLSKNELSCVTAFLGFPEIFQTLKVNKRLKNSVENSNMCREYKKALDQCKQQKLKSISDLIVDNCKFIKEREEEMIKADFSKEQISQLILEILMFFSKGTSNLTLKKTSDDKTLEYMKIILNDKQCPFVSLSFN